MIQWALYSLVQSPVHICCQTMINFCLLNGLVSSWKSCIQESLWTGARNLRNKRPGLPIRDKWKIRLGRIDSSDFLVLFPYPGGIHSNDFCVLRLLHCEKTISRSKLLHSEQKIEIFRRWGRRAASKIEKSFKNWFWNRLTTRTYRP